MSGTTPLCIQAVIRGLIDDNQFIFVPLDTHITGICSVFITSI